MVCKGKEKRWNNQVVERRCGSLIIYWHCLVFSTCEGPQHRFTLVNQDHTILKAGTRTHTHKHLQTSKIMITVQVSLVTTSSEEDTFQLYDLHVEVICLPGERILCGAKQGDHFTLKGEMLHLPPGQGFSIYSLSAVLPLLAAKQRATHPNDWMSTDAEIACPDPNCKSRLKISRMGLRMFRHADVTAVPLSENGLSKIEY